MSISNLLDGGGRELHHRFGFDQRHLSEGGLDTETSSHSSEPTEELRRYVFLKVMPKRGVVRFGKRGKLSSRFIRPFEILERVGTVSYRLVLPPSLSGVHEVFHVSMLRKYTPDPTHVVDWGELTIDTYETFEEGPVHIMDSRE